MSDLREPPRSPCGCVDDSEAGDREQDDANHGGHVPFRWLLRPPVDCRHRGRFHGPEHYRSAKSPDQHSVGDGSSSFSLAYPPTPDGWGTIRAVQAPGTCSRERYTPLISEEPLKEWCSTRGRVRTRRSRSPHVEGGTTTLEVPSEQHVRTRFYRESIEILPPYPPISGCVLKYIAAGQSTFAQVGNLWITPCSAFGTQRSPVQIRAARPSKCRSAGVHAPAGCLSGEAIE